MRDTGIYVNTYIRGIETKKPLPLYHAYKTPVVLSNSQIIYGHTGGTKHLQDNQLQSLELPFKTFLCSDCLVFFFWKSFWRQSFVICFQSLFILQLGTHPVDYLMSGLTMGGLFCCHRYQCPQLIVLIPQSALARWHLYREYTELEDLILC